jgi:hypothetical protein
VELELLVEPFLGREGFLESLGLVYIQIKLVVASNCFDSAILEKFRKNEGSARARNLWKESEDKNSRLGQRGHSHLLLALQMAPCTVFTELELKKKKL